MKHKLQCKFVGIMFLSLFTGILFQAVVEGIYGGRHHLTAEETEVIFESGQLGVWMDAAFFVVVVSVFFLLSRNIIKRMEQLNQSIQQISRGNMKEIPVDKHRDEVGELSKSISKMAEMLEGSLENEQSMVRNIAHDLRTPVTSIQGYAQLLGRSEELSLQNREYVDIIERKSVHLSEQIEELLEYSILQFEEKEYAFEELSLSSLAEQVLIDFIPQMEKIDMSFSLTGNQEPHVISCNQALMVRLLENLVNNALRYGKKGKVIEVFLSEDGANVLLEVANYGAVMTKAQLQNIFEPFYQGEDAKEYSTQSKGLGLAIVSKIVKIHHGTIEAECREEEKRIVFRMVLPKS